MNGLTNVNQTECLYFATEEVLLSGDGDDYGDDVQKDIESTVEVPYETDDDYGQGRNEY